MYLKRFFSSVYVLTAFFSHIWSQETSPDELKQIFSKGKVQLLLEPQLPVKGSRWPCSLTRRPQTSVLGGKTASVSLPFSLTVNVGHLGPWVVSKCWQMLNTAMAVHIKQTLDSKWPNITYLLQWSLKAHCSVAAVLPKWALIWVSLWEKWLKIIGLYHKQTCSDADMALCAVFPQLSLDRLN